MLEKLIVSQLLLPLIAVGALVLALACFKLGWSFKSFGARRRETALQKDIRDARISVPQLESTLRSREQLLARLQDEVQAQKGRYIQLQGEQTERERLLKGAQTEIRHLTHELSAIKGKSVDSLEFDLGLSNDAVGSVSEATSSLAEKLQSTEKLYEKLKAAVIERSQRIEVLERQLQEAEGGFSLGEPAMLSNAEIDALHRQLDQRNRSISDLNAQVAQLKQEKEMVEDLAQKRSKSNRSLKDSKTDVEARKLELEQAVATHQKTISDRELSIHRLMSEVQVVRKNLRDSVEEAHRLKRANAVKDDALIEALETRQSLEQAISQRESKLLALQFELDKAGASVVLLQREIADLSRQAQEHLTASGDPLGKSGHPDHGRSGLQPEQLARLAAPGDLEAELDVRHRAHQDSDAVGERVSTRTQRIAPLDDLSPHRVAGDRNDS